jgi:hypothetical protein
MGYAPVGPIAKKGLPLYMGRFLDPKTNRIKLISKPSYIYDKYSWQESFDHAVTMAAYRWNSFVKS